jgi:hypothetical protein
MTTAPAQTDLLDTRDVAQLLNVPDRFVWVWQRLGLGPMSFGVGGGAPRYRRDGVVRWLAAGGVTEEMLAVIDAVDRARRAASPAKRL